MQESMDAIVKANSETCSVSEADWGPDYATREFTQGERIRRYLLYSLEQSVASMESMKPNIPTEYYDQTKHVLDIVKNQLPPNLMSTRKAIDIMLDHIHKWSVRTDPSCGPYQGA